MESVKVHDLLSTATRWCKGAFAVNNFGLPVNATDPTACRWCIAGAIIKIYGFTTRMLTFRKMREFIESKYPSIKQDIYNKYRVVMDDGSVISYFNDNFP